ncbi:rhodanese-like domain-containing protein [Desulfocurvibacter africanus]|uniref:rhodanese-like domain-containing protein n=1 Tax=Desulfocurvibacter africanus TaxID=873 RepID=UPI00040EA303|nr:rhodanese-like domain-containing protein [Desulfocurvibacter africanus]
MWILGLVILIAAGLIFWELGFRAAGVRRISSATLDRWRREGRRFTIVDVRSPLEHGWFRVPDSLNEPRLVLTNRLPDSLKDAPRDQPLVTVCMSGHRSDLAARNLREQGFSEVYSLSGGAAGWRLGGHETEQGPTGGPGSPASPGWPAWVLRMPWYWVWASISLMLLMVGLWRHGAVLILLALIGIVAAWLGFPPVREGSLAAQALAATKAWLREPLNTRKVLELIVGLTLVALFVWSFWTHRLGTGIVVIIAAVVFKVLAYRRMTSG